MADYEYKSGQQVNVNFGETFNMTKKAPAISKRIFDTYENAKAYVNNPNDSAIAGLLITVINDTVFNYKQISNKVTEAEKDTLVANGYVLLDQLPPASEESENKVVVRNGDGEPATYTSYEKQDNNGLYQVVNKKTGDSSIWTNGLKLVKNASESGQGGVGATYKGSESIILDEGQNSFSTNSAIIALGSDEQDNKDIKITNPVGGWGQGETITMNQDIKSILRKLFTKLEDVTTTKPKVSFEIKSDDNMTTWTNKTYNMEVGDIVKGNLTYSYPNTSTGSYNGWWLNDEGIVYAKCEKVTEGSQYDTTGKTSGIASVPLTSTYDPLAYNSTSVALKEGTTTVTLKFNYSQGDESTRLTIKKNDGETQTEKTIPAGTATASTTFNTRYKYYYKYVPYESAEDMNIVETLDNLEGYTEGWVASSAYTDIPSIKGTAEAPMCVLLVPMDKGKIIDTRNDQGFYSEGAWSMQTDTMETALKFGAGSRIGSENVEPQKVYNHNGTTSPYNVFIMRSQQPTTYNHIRFAAEDYGYNRPDKIN